MIAKALSADARVLILDEPTSSLTLHEANNLFGVLRQLRASGVTIVFVSHKLEEVLDIADRVSVLRDGRLVDTHPATGLSKDQIVTMMLGREARTAWLGTLDIDRSRVVIEARGITQPDRFDGLDFDLHAGEILGFYGLVGSGRTELAQILIGEDRDFDGEILVEGCSGADPGHGRGTQALPAGIRVREPQGEGSDPRRQHRDEHRDHRLGPDLAPGDRDRSWQGEEPWAASTWRPSKCAPPAWISRSGGCRVATSRRSASRSGSPPAATRSSSTSRRSAWTWEPRRRSTA